MIDKNNKLVIERLTALWALTECGFGGFLHAFKSPFTGVLVGGISILLISLIALYSKNIWQQVLKALTIVLLIKLSVSPHSPVMAYLALAFQAIVGALIFNMFKVKPLSILFLGVITFLESAIQKLLVLTLLFGNSFWQAIDAYGLWVENRLTFLNFSFSSKSLIIFYVSVYFIASIIVSYFIIKIIKAVKSNNAQTKMLFNFKTQVQLQNKSKSKGFNKKIIFGLVALALVVFPLLNVESNYNGLQKGVLIFIRSVSVVLLWYLVAAPFFIIILNKILNQSKSKYQTEIQNTLALFPYLKSIISVAWQESKLLKGTQRFEQFMVKSIVYTLHFKPNKE